MISLLVELPSNVLRIITELIHDPCVVFNGILCVCKDLEYQCNLYIFLCSYWSHNRNRRRSFNRTSSRDRFYNLSSYSSHNKKYGIKSLSLFFFRSWSLDCIIIYALQMFVFDFKDSLILYFFDFFIDFTPGRVAI